MHHQMREPELEATGNVSKALVIVIMPQPQRSIVQRKISCKSPTILSLGIELYGSAGRVFAVTDGASVVECRRQRHHSSCWSDLETPIVVCNEADFRSRLYLTQMITPLLSGMQYSAVPET